MLMWFLFDHFLKRRITATPATAQQLHQLPPQPRLQQSPAEDLATLRRHEDQALHSYQWVDRQRHIAAIPIDEAMNIVVRQGLPFKTGPRSEVYPPSAGAKETGFR